MDELDLYPRINPLQAIRNGVSFARSEWRRIVVYGLVVVVVFGAAAYRWVTTATPMDRASAVELFRAQTDGSGVGAAEGNGARSQQRPRIGSQRADGRAERNHSKTRPGKPSIESASRPDGVKGNAGRRQTSAGGGQEQTFSLPREGVYSWATDGYEQVSGARRQFPKESQRIVTHEGQRSWLVHHYFSEEREIWTNFHWGSGGAEIERQRNKVTFGPITNDSAIDFDPPMLVGPKDLEVGYVWGGEWRGETYGDYSSEIFEHKTLDIGGERVEVWGVAYEINLHGKQEGRVVAKVWLAPDHGLTVREYYKQDIESSGARYQAEWTMQLKSLEPQQ